MVTVEMTEAADIGALAKSLNYNTETLMATVKMNEAASTAALAETLPFNRENYMAEEELRTASLYVGDTSKP